MSNQLRIISFREVLDVSSGNAGPADMTPKVADERPREHGMPSKVMQDPRPAHFCNVTNSTYSQDPGLEKLGLIEFIACDSRPTYIVDLFETDRNCVAYLNPALNRLLANGWDPACFREWAASLKRETKATDHGGRVWSGTLLQQRWLVVNISGHELQEVHPQSPPVPGTPLQQSAPPLPALSSWSDNSNHSTYSSSPRSRNHSVTSSSWQTVSDDGSRFLDWTQSPSPYLSAHVRHVRNLAWQETSLGSMQSWSDTLRQNVLSVMANPDPRLLLWGDDNVMIYNEACAPLFGPRHPHALGSKAKDTWSETWEDIKPLFRHVQVEGRGSRLTKLPLTMTRNGYAEDTFWTFSLVPIVGPQGHTVGISAEVHEVTDQVVNDRRRAAAFRINHMIAKVDSMKELWFEFLEGLEPCREDIPYALFHTLPAAGDVSIYSTSSGTASQKYALEGSIGIANGHPSIPLSFDLTRDATDATDLVRNYHKAWKTGEITVLRAKDGTLPENLAVSVPGRASGDKVETVCIIPVQELSGSQTMAFLTLALTPRRPYDSEAAMFAHYLHDILVKSASAICMPEEQRRARQKFEQIEASLAQELRVTALEAERLEQRYAKMSQIAPVGMYTITSDSRTIFYNDAYLEITGISKEAIEANQDPAAYVHEDDRARVMGAWVRCLEDRETLTCEYRVRRPWNYVDPVSGETFTGETWILAKAIPEIDEHGSVVCVQGWLLDISDRKYHEKLRLSQVEIEQAEVRFSRLAADAPLGMYLLKPDGTPLYLNDAYFEILGFTREEFEEAQQRGVGWADQIHEDDKCRVFEAWQALAQHGMPLNLEYRVKKPWKYIDEATGTQMTGETWLQGTAVAEIGIDGTPVAVQGFVNEISLKKFSERLLAEKLEDALETKKQADRFIDMTSHEMRNPLSAILQSADGILTSLEGNDYPNSLGILTSQITPTRNGLSSFSSDTIETVVDSAQTIILCAQHQKRIVDDILTLSKLDSNLLVISPDAVFLPGLIEKCFKMYEAELDRAQIQAVLQVHEGYRTLGIENVMLDSSRLLQVIINLMTNGIKFTQSCSRRKIFVHLDASLVRPTNGMYGAPYVPFRSGGSEHSFTSEWGTGDEVFLHVSVEDSGKGLNEEELKLLFHRFSQASPKTYKQYGGSGLGLFISRELTELQDGQIGVHSEAGKGSTFSFYIKARKCVQDDDNLSDSRVPTPTLISSPMTYTRDGNIGRVNPSKVSSSVTSNGLSPQAPQVFTRTMSVSSGQSHPSPLHVLVVEDNVINQRVMAQQLRRLGCNVHLANHGGEALEFLRTTTYWRQSEVDKKARFMAEAPSPKTVVSDDAVPLSVILMDLEMPVLGGLECVKQIRTLQQEGYIVGHVPVIAVTANARSEQISIAIDHGMDSVVTKPFRIPELIPQMESLVHRVSNGRGSIGGRASVVGNTM